MKEFRKNIVECDNFSQHKMHFKKVLCLLLSLVMLFSITSVIPITAEAASYSSNYKRWSQNKSDYKWMREAGCAVVAEAKMIYEAGIKTSSFNPDVYFKWCKDKGYVRDSGPINKQGFVYADNAVRYANSLGNTKLKYEGNTTKGVNDKIKSNAKNGYYSIVCVGSHYVMVDNAKTKSTGTIYIYDSWGAKTTKIPGKDSYTLSEMKYAAKSVRTFKYGGTPTVKNPSVSVNSVTNLAKNSVQLNFTANNPSKVTIKKVGVQVRKKGTSEWKTKSEAMNSKYTNASSVKMWWTVGSKKEFNISLSAGTTYEYRAYVVYNNKNYYSSTSTFTTKSAVKNPSVTVNAVTNLAKKSVQLNFTANNPSKVTIKKVGVQVRKKGTSEWKTKSEAMNSKYTNATSVKMWWTVGSKKELNMSLSAGTTYEYRAYVVYNNKNYYSTIKTFTTKK